eukprot:TRINITY_DN13408_c0_g1_i4.p2 TRINITY_DN13408_c0_g1~~TRINITY_DN13408_c0_g1_i4.p2  ORF type:complete len:115 (+),score=5.96 TRINITY_DN13408_c0_g1_i4:80-424(+)
MVQNFFTGCNFDNIQQISTKQILWTKHMIWYQKNYHHFVQFFFGGNIVTFFKLSIEKNIRIDELPSTIFLVTIQQQNQDEGFFFFNFAGDRKFRVGYFQPQPIKIQTLPKIVIL